MSVDGSAIPTAERARLVALFRRHGASRDGAVAILAAVELTLADFLFWRAVPAEPPLAEQIAWARRVRRHINKLVGELGIALPRADPVSPMHGFAAMLMGTAGRFEKAVENAHAWLVPLEIYPKNLSCPAAGAGDCRQD
jgi:hypothetical protein